jgi:hypothetical protein
MAGQPWQERCDKMARKVRTGQGNQDRTTMAGQPGQDSLDRRAKLGKYGRTVVIGHIG